MLFTSNKKISLGSLPHCFLDIGLYLHTILLAFVVVDFGEFIAFLCWFRQAISNVLSQLIN